MKIIDSSGLKCPIPLLFLRRGLVSASAGEKVCLISTDQKSLDDVPKFCEQMGHTLIDIQVQEKEENWHFIVAKKQ